jgi:hypothetical protein
MLALMNVLTTRTVPTFLYFNNPFAKLEKSHEVTNATQAHAKLIETFEGIEADINALNSNNSIRPIPYVHLLPSNIDPSLSI